jgi:hypothetical protein
VRPSGAVSRPPFLQCSSPPLRPVLLCESALVVECTFVECTFAEQHASSALSQSSTGRRHYAASLEKSSGSGAKGSVGLVQPAQAQHVHTSRERERASAALQTWHTAAQGERLQASAEGERRARVLCRVAPHLPPRAALRHRAAPRSLRVSARPATDGHHGSCCTRNHGSCCTRNHGSCSTSERGSYFTASAARGPRERARRAPPHQPRGRRRHPPPPGRATRANCPRARPVNTGGGTRRVRLVRGEGRGVSS